MLQQRLAEDEIMKKHKIPPLESPMAPRQLGPVLFKLAAELTPPCKTISLANNNLTNTHNISSLNHYLPTLNALSLENNKFRSLRDLDGLSHKAVKGSLSSITELVLRGNPLRDTAVQEGRMESFRKYAYTISKVTSGLITRTTAIYSEGFLCLQFLTRKRSLAWRSMLKLRQ